MKIISTCRAPSFGHSAAHTAPPLGGQYATPLSQGKMFFIFFRHFLFTSRVRTRFNGSIPFTAPSSETFPTCKDSIFLALVYIPKNVCSTLSMAVKSVSKKREDTSDIFHPENMIWPHTSLLLCHQNQMLYIQIS